MKKRAGEGDQTDWWRFGFDTQLGGLRVVTTEEIIKQQNEQIEGMDCDNKHTTKSVVSR